MVSQALGALVAYVQPEDNLAVERSQFHAATAWLYAGSSASNVAANSKANQAWFGECLFADFINPRAGGGHGLPAVAVQHDGGRSTVSSPTMTTTSGAARWRC